MTDPDEFVLHFHKFVDSQVKLLRDMNTTIMNNATEWHRKHCLDSEKDDNQCEQAFLYGFQIAFGEKLSGGRLKITIKDEDEKEEKGVGFYL